MSEPLVCAADCDADGLLHLDLPRSQYQAVSKARFAGKRVDIEVRERKSKRGLRANAALHAGLYELAAFLGHAGKVADVFVEQFKDDLLALCWGYIVRQNQFTGEIVNSLVQPHTSDLSVEQFSELFEYAVVEAAKLGHIWRLPEEFKRKAA